MKKITKILVGVFFASLLSTSIQAGELAVTGGANATITSGGADQASGKAVGVSNELAFSASGELDNGWTWNYTTELDGTSTATDDVALTIGTGYGTVGFFSHEGGLRTNVIGVGALGAGQDYKSPMTFEVGYNVDGYGNVQYHTPAGMLPFGAQVKVGYVPNLANTSVLSAKEFVANTNQNVGRNLTQYQVSVIPVEGLSLKGDVATTGGATGTSGAGGREQGVSANIQALYSMGPISIGYMEGGYQPAVGSGEITYYENKSYGISFAVNDSVVVSYNYDESAKNARTAVADAGTGKGTKTVKTAEQDTYQIAYTMGGMTVGYSMAEVSNSDYRTGHNETLNILSLAMSF
jgi:hypothetical protein